MSKTGTEIPVLSRNKREGAATSVAENGFEDNATEVVSPKESKKSGAAASAAENRILKRNLPHISLPNHYQFVTFRTHDSIDEYLKKLSSAPISTSLKQYKTDEYLDRSSKGAYLYGEVLTYIASFLREQDGKLYDLVAFSVMPNHLHILFRQKEELGRTIRIIKGSSSVVINKILGRKGTFWEKGYFDKAIRDERHFETVYNYIANNASKANLPDAQERFYGIYE